MSRVSDTSMNRTYLNHLNKAKSDWMKTVGQISSTHRFERISEDVTSGIRVMNARNSMYKTEVYKENVDTVNTELAMMEDTMMDLSSVLERVHELGVKGANEPLGSHGREAVIAELEVLQETILNMANSAYNGKYLFGGANATSVPPFSVNEDGRLSYNGIPVDSIKQDQDGNYWYNKDGVVTPVPMEEDIYMDIGLGIKLKESQVVGNSAFLVSMSGLQLLGFGATEYTLEEGDSGFDPNNDVTCSNSNNLYNMITELVHALENYDDSSEVMAVDDRIVHQTELFGTNITTIGTKTLYLNNLTARLEKDIINYKTSIDNLMGTELEDAAITLSTQDMILKAVQQIGSQILPNSLMDYI